MPGTPKELDLEKYIVSDLTSQPIVKINGEVLVAADGTTQYEYRQLHNSDYDKALCFCPKEVVAFLKDSQTEEWDKMVNAAGSEDAAIRSLCSRLDTELKHGTLDVLKSKNGISAG